MIKKLFILLLLSVVFSSCKKDDSTPVNSDVSAYISGFITMNGIPVSGVVVSINNNFRLSSTTNTSGMFQIYNLTKGTYTLKAAYSLSNGSYVTLTRDFTIENQNISVGTINMFTPPMIVSLDSSKTTSVTITWNKINDPDFKEYDVYKSSTADFDEAHGEFLYKTTTRNDTVYTDNSYVKGVPKYYRVFVHTTSTKFYASTLEGIHTPPKNFVLNGSFESLQTSFPPGNWQYDNGPGVKGFDYFNIVTSEVKEGSKSLQINWVDTISAYSHEAILYQRIQPNNLVAGREYNLSFWVKSDTGAVTLTFLINEQAQYFGIPSKQDWTKLDYSFLMTEQITSLRIEIIATGKPKGIVQGWIDNIQLNEKK